MATKRQTKSEQTRQRILAAAAKIVGSIGYAKASVTRITGEAKIASGGFYYYFKTREDMFDELLPALGKEMIEFISERLHGAGWGIERETRAFDAYLAYLRERPEFYRVFAEAYVYAPSAYKKHFTAMIQNYKIALQIQRDKGYLDISDDEITLLAYFLIGIRNYVSQLYMERLTKKSLSSQLAIDLYRTLIAGGVFRAVGRADALDVKKPKSKSRVDKVSA